ncbi:MAG TPA: ATP synthase F1 subunit epsilon [Candidatus Saccharimonadales bacterium]|nr:ATP synthase F1 subunit epsilon [Candidatus Saccharimonadales bacterium]
MNLELVTLDGVKYKADAYSVVLPTADGVITVLPGHEPLLAQLVAGVITIRRTKGEADYHQEHFATFGGVLEISRKGVRILVDEATHGDEISVEEAKRAHEKALQMRKDAKTQVELDRAETMLTRQGVRLEVAELRRRSRRHQ